MSEVRGEEESRKKGRESIIYMLGLWIHFPLPLDSLLSFLPLNTTI